MTNLAGLVSVKTRAVTGRSKSTTIRVARP